MDMNMDTDTDTGFSLNSEELIKADVRHPSILPSPSILVKPSSIFHRQMPLFLKLLYKPISYNQSRIGFVFIIYVKQVISHIIVPTVFKFLQTYLLCTNNC
jgi:hypothetical protein